MKSIARPFLAEGEYLSANDLLFAFVLMLKYEVSGRISGDGSFDVTDTVAACAAECLTNGIHVFPENYVGNGSVTISLSIQGLEIESRSLCEVLVTFARMMRKGITDYRQQPELQAQAFLSTYYTVFTGTLPPATESMVSFVSNVSRTPWNDVDFGKGPPRMAKLINLLPFTGVQTTFGPAPGRDSGVLVYVVFTDSQYAKFKKSRVVQTIAPDMKLFYSEITTEEVDTMLKS